MTTAHLDCTDALATYRKRAVVVGSGIAGLLAAQVLSRRFESVTVVERDIPPSQPEPRSGVPQSRHCHLLLLRGQQLMNDMFPGLETELLARGAARIDWIADVALYWHDTWVPRFPSGMLGHCSSRDLLELVIRERVQRIPSVTFATGQEVAGLLLEGGGIRGVRVRARKGGGETSEIEGDLVVDASGRRSHLPQWLEESGYSAPDESIVESFAGYASRLYEMPPDVAPDWKVLVVRSTFPASRAGGIYPMEGRRWLVTLTGYADDAPAPTEEGFQQFLDALPSPAISDALRGAKALSPIIGYRGTATTWRHYERLRRVPEGLIAMGDAVSCFNPVYAQGMAVSVLGAQVLDHCLIEQRRRCGGALDGLSARFFRELAKANRGPWLMATSEDYRYPTTKGGRPSPSIRLVQSYLNRVLDRVVDSPELLRSFVEVMHMLKPPQTLLRPDIVARAIVPPSLLPGRP